MDIANISDNQKFRLSRYSYLFPRDDIQRTQISNIGTYTLSNVKRMNHFNSQPKRLSEISMINTIIKLGLRCDYVTAVDRMITLHNHYTMK